MALAVVAVPTTLAGATFTFVVPGGQRWTILAVRATVHRAVGGTPNRAFTITVSDGTSTVAQSGADDAGTEPGTCTVTYCDVASSSVASGSTGITVGSLPQLTIDPGYVITGTILNPAATDAWLDAVTWIDYVDA